MQVVKHGRPQSNQIQPDTVCARARTRRGQCWFGGGPLYSNKRPRASPTPEELRPADQGNTSTAAAVHTDIADSIPQAEPRRDRPSRFRAVPNAPEKSLNARTTNKSNTPSGSGTRKNTQKSTWPAHIFQTQPTPNASRPFSKAHVRTKASRLPRRPSIAWKEVRQAPKNVQPWFLLQVGFSGWPRTRLAACFRSGWTTCDLEIEAVGFRQLSSQGRSRCRPA